MFVHFKEPQQIEEKCDEPLNVSNADITGVDPTGNSVDSEVEYQCQGNRLFPDFTKRKKITCLLGGTWSTLSHSECNGRLFSFLRSFVSNLMTFCVVILIQNLLSNFEKMIQ